MAFTVDVLRKAGRADFTRNGITKFRDQVTVVEFDGMELVGPDAPDEDCPAIRIVKRTLDGTDYYHAEPMKIKEGMKGPTWGWNWVVGNCPTWRGLVGHRPIPMHDRFVHVDEEVWDQKPV